MKNQRKTLKAYREAPRTCGKQLLAPSAFILAALGAAPSFAQNSIIAPPSRPFASVARSDLAQVWIDYLFRGDQLPDQMASYAAPLQFAADGLRHALSLYSVAMLTFAALLVFYHLASMVAETAQSGIPFGGRANQLWMPIRFVLAIGLLVPVTSSLSAGQYIIVRLAEEGSTLASNAWRTVAREASGHLSGLVTPRGPDVGHLATTAVEMEICRSVYSLLYTPLSNDTVIHLTGNITDITKTPADRFNVETWRYTNLLNSNVPLCGEYSFTGYRRPLFGEQTLRPDAASRMAEQMSAFAHTQADDLQTQARAIGDRVAPVFLSSAAPIGADVRQDLTTLENTLSTRMTTESLELSGIGTDYADQTLATSVDFGWMTSASFILEFVRLQATYSELMSHALPVVQSPVFAHPRTARQVLNDGIALSPVYMPLEGATPEKLITFYANVGRIAAQVHAWIFGTQMPDKDFVTPASADMQDILNAGTDPDTASSFLTNAFDGAAVTYGVWGIDPSVPDTGYPFGAVPSEASFNPFGALVEFGRRQIELANTLASLAGTGLASPGATGPAVLFGLASFLFFVGGVLLIFIAPLLPFLRFLMATLAWVLNVFEAVVAVPVVALAHLTPVGGGLSGGLARQAYILWLGLLVRPVLTLFGFVFGLVLFVLSITFIGAVLTPFARLSLPSNGGLLVGTNAGLVLLYDVLVYAAANASFRAISWLPDNALRWTSQFVVTDPGEQRAIVTGGGSGPSGSTLITNVLAPMFSSSSRSSSTATGGAGATSTAAQAAQSNALKQALMPTYADRPAASDLALGATTGLSTAAGTHFADHSPGVTNVSVTAPSTGGTTPGPATTQATLTPGKNRFAGGTHASSIGGKERGLEVGKDGGGKPAASPDTSAAPSAPTAPTPSTDGTPTD